MGTYQKRLTMALLIRVHNTSFYAQEKIRAFVDSNCYGIVFPILHKKHVVGTHL